MTKTGIYLRVSTAGQVEGFGLAAQETKCREYARVYDYEVVQVYRDEGISGSKGLKYRKGLAAALRDAQEGNIDMIVMASLDRMARKTKLLLDLYDKFENTGCGIVMVKERIDTSTAIGRLMRTVLAAIAEFEVDTTTMRMKGGRLERAKEDGEIGGRLPFGYERKYDDNGKSYVVVNQEAAETVSRIFGLRYDGYSMADIAYDLNMDKVPTPQGGKRWYPMTVKIILDNEDYYAGGRRNFTDDMYWIPII